MTETIFLIFLIIAIKTDIKTECEDYRTAGILKKTCLVLAIALHVYNIIRLCHKIYYNVRTQISVKASIWKCILIDCYCCIATFVYACIQSGYFLLRTRCMKELASITYWLFAEISYQYSQVALYIVSNSLVILMIVI